MNCYMCKCDMTENKTTHFVDLKSCIVIIKNVPCLECVQCGEKYYIDDIAKRLDEIVESVSDAMTEIAIINFSDKVA